MIDVSFAAKKTPLFSGHVIRTKVGNSSFMMKFDTGAKDTVISSDVFHGAISDESRDKLIRALDAKKLNTKEFVSASGDGFKGYLVKAKEVSFDKCKLPVFYYYIVVKNKRVIALLGEDFIDNCKYSHEPSGDICITQFNDEAYDVSISGSLSEDDLVSLIEGLA